jgi:hypothetical protein
LKEGVIPDAKYNCGSAPAATDTHGIITGVQNYYTYGIGVTATDLVGNAGPLSAVICQTPKPVDDFFKIYKQAGGEGGGTFCSIQGAIGKKASYASLGFLALAAAGAFMRRRRS